MPVWELMMIIFLSGFSSAASCADYFGSLFKAIIVPDNIGCPLLPTDLV
jgi:hypothetical protein